jgi:hypothetical protein
MQPQDRPRATWNLIALTMPFVGFVFGVVGGLTIPFLLDQHPMEGPTWGMRVWFCFCGLGLLADLAALIRMERWWGVTAVGFLLNVALVGFTGTFIGGR